MSTWQPDRFFYFKFHTNQKKQILKWLKLKMWCREHTKDYLWLMAGQKFYLNLNMFMHPKHSLRTGREYVWELHVMWGTKILPKLAMFTWPSWIHFQIYVTNTSYVSGWKKSYVNVNVFFKLWNRLEKQKYKNVL